MNWLVFALVSVLAVSIAPILERVVLKDDKSDPIGYAIVFQILLGFISLVCALFMGDFSLPALNVAVLFNMLLSTLFWAGATTFIFKALKELGASEVTIIGSSGAVVSIILSILFLGESFSGRIAVGTACVLVSILLVGSQKLSFEPRRGIIFALLFALCSGAAVVSDASLLNLGSYGALSHVAIMSFLPGIALAIMFPKKLKDSKDLIVSKSFKMMALFTFFYAIQAIAYYSSYKSGALMSHLSPISKSSIILTVILGIIFLKERKGLIRKILAAVIVTFGVVLLR